MGFYGRMIILIALIPQSHRCHLRNETYATSLSLGSSPGVVSTNRYQYIIVILNDGTEAEFFLIFKVTHPAVFYCKPPPSSSYATRISADFPHITETNYTIQYSISRDHSSYTLHSGPYTVPPFTSSQPSLPTHRQHQSTPSGSYLSLTDLSQSYLLPNQSSLHSGLSPSASLR